MSVVYAGGEERYPWEVEAKKHPVKRGGVPQPLPYEVQRQKAQSVPVTALTAKRGEVVGQTAPRELQRTFLFIPPEPQKTVYQPEKYTVPPAQQPQPTQAQESLSMSERDWRKLMESEEYYLNPEKSPQIDPLTRHGIAVYLKTAEAGIGVVAGAESLVYGFGRLLGFQTPTPPPTFLGGVLGTTISPATGGFTTTPIAATTSRGFGYTMGTILFDVGTAWLIGKGLEKTPIGKALTKIETKVEAPFIKGLAKTDIGKWILKKTGRLEYVGASNVSSWGKSTYFGKGSTKTPMSVTLEKASLSKGGLLQQVLVPQEIMVPKTIPYLTPATPTLIIPIVFPSTPTITKTQPQKIELPTIGQKTKTVLKLEPKTVTRKKTLEITIPRLFSETSQKQEEMAFTVPAFIQESKVKQKQLLRMKQVTLQKQRTERKYDYRLDFNLPKIKVKTPRVGKWFKRTHAIPTPKEVMKAFSGSPRKKKGGRKKRFTFTL